MASGRDERVLVIGVTPGGRPDGRLVVGVCRAGGFGVLDMGTNLDAAWRELALVERRYGGVFGVRLPAGVFVEPVALPDQVSTVLLDGTQQVAGFQAAGRRVLVEVTSIQEADVAVQAGADGLIVKGAESGGRIGEETAFVLLQRVVRRIDGDRPVWAQGGIGLHSAAAAVAGGATGVVVDSQLALARDCSLPAPVRLAVAVMDGSETTVIAGHRVYTRPDLPAPDLAAPPDLVRSRLGADDLHTQLLPVGQDAAFASGLADRYKTAGGIVQALRAAIDSHLTSVRESQPLSPGAGVAERHGLRYPIAQGPMTRVSDRAAFASVVAEAGGLPFLALSLLRGQEITDLLDATRRQVGDRPWGVGILGFVPPELREEQLAAVREARPPVALVAGGRPSQAAPLEADGIATFLHVPSPGLLDRFLRDGARRFVFEGRECGGHVGPRSSFVLWEQQTERLLAEDDLGEVEVFFAGGIHDARSAAMVATLAAPLVERGAHIGVLMGTAYMATAEAVATGAITPMFQQVVLECRDTVLLETSPGHATRCVDSDYVAAFARRRDELVAAGAPSRDMWAELETLNLGRLRTAAKGIVREGDELVAVDASTQRREGMFMIGQVAALHSRPTSVARLHAEVSEGSSRLLAGLEPEPTTTLVNGGNERARGLDIAVIGAAGLFPGAGSVEEFWANVVDGVDSIREVPAERWSVERYYEPDPNRAAAEGKTPSRWGGFLDPVPFDPMLYGIPPRSVASIGPDQLLSLQVAATALAHAGYADREFDRERTAVVFGAESGTDLAAAYAFRAALPHFVGEVPAELADKLPSLTEDSFPGVLANVIAGRIANRLDLGGANYTVDAACGASMAALSAACKELTSGAADMVLCGGADLHNGIYDYLLFSGVHALSPTGHCRTFDAGADGIALGEGIGCVVLKRLADAERDGDQVLAVLDAVAASSDGRSLGLTAPRREGQRRALERAYDEAGVSPATVGLVEAHGTGTVVGDRTELSTLTDVYTERGAVPGSTALGSVKSQIGHTKCAAGMAGLIKAVHAVHRGVLPPTLHVAEPNQAYDPKTSPFAFFDRARPWVGEQRRAAVSAFGFGGSNFHAVVSSYRSGDDPDHGVDHWPAELFLLRGPDALDHLTGLLDGNDAAGRPWPLRDLARTVAERLPGAPAAYAFVANDLDDVRSKLDGLLAGARQADVFVAAGAWGDAGGDEPAPDETLGKVAFLFPGQGSQRVHMAADLFVAFPALRRFLDLAGPELTDRMFPPAFGVEGGDRPTLTDTRLAQPALGVVELAMADLLRRCGVRPDVTAGHSYGELPALAVAGVLDEAAVLVLSRARAEAILGALPADDPGTMAAVRGPVDEVRALLGEVAGVVVANDNTPEQCVISGRTADVDAAARLLSDHGHAVRRLAVGCAFHSPELAAASDVLREHLAALPVESPQLPVWSNTTAAPYPDAAGEVRELLAMQVSSPVAFRQQVEAMYDAGARTFVEVGPGRVLCQLVRRVLGDRPHRTIACDVDGEHGIRRFLLALAELAVLPNIPVDVSPLFAGRTAVVDAPTSVRPAPLLLDGQLIRDREGQVVAGTLPPATEFPPLRLAGSPAAGLNGNGSNGNGSAPDMQATVAEYLRGLQQIVSAERDVVLALLGAPMVGGAVQAASIAPPTVTQLEPVVALPTAVEPAPVTGQPLDHAGWLAVVVEVVSERTGYPAEMLDPDLDLEAELSIDSIKRIEILAELADRVALPGMDDIDADEQLIEELAGVKTLRGIVDLILERSTVLAPVSGAITPRKGARTLQRYVPELVTLAEATNDRALADVMVGVVGGRSTVAGPLCDVLRRADAVPLVLDSDEAVHDGLGVLVDLTALHPGDRDDPTAAVTALFARLRAAADAGVPEIVVVTGLGGAFGLAGSAGDDEVTTSIGAAALGIVRTMARELSDVRWRVVDLPAAGDPELRGAQIAAELACADAPAEVGYSGTARQAVQIASRDGSDSEAEHHNGFHLGPHSIVLVTGGARGIGARCALELARRYGCGFEIVGRTPVPVGEEAPDMAEAHDERAIRQVLVERGQLTRPAEIEVEVRRIVATREMRRNLAELQTHAQSVGYHTVDVRDPAALGETVDEIRLRHGRLDGVVHAAGVRDDKRVGDKTLESFARVFDTKVRGAGLLADAVDYGGFAVFFGSVSGVFGNAGQVDYAAANSVLDVLAHVRSGVSRERRLLSIDWGPWDGGGMVTPELARQYAKRGVGLVDPDAGAAALVEELRRGAPDPQVVLMAASPDAFGPGDGGTDG